MKPVLKDTESHTASQSFTSVAPSPNSDSTMTDTSITPRFKSNISREFNGSKEGFQKRDAEVKEVESRDMKGEETLHEDPVLDDQDDEDDLSKIKPKTWAGWFLLKGAQIVDYMDRVGEVVLGTVSYPDNTYDDAKYVKEREKELHVEQDEGEVGMDDVAQEEELDDMPDYEHAVESDQETTEESSKAVYRV